MCTALYERERHRIGELQHSGKTLRMVNGDLIPSKGFWEGYVRFTGARVQACFEVFPSGGSWSFLFGKPLLEGFGAVHDYAVDSITVPGVNGPTVVSNQIGRLGLWDEARGGEEVAHLLLGESTFLTIVHRKALTGNGVRLNPQRVKTNPGREYTKRHKGTRRGFAIPLEGMREPEDDSKMEDMTEEPAREAKWENSEDTRVTGDGSVASAADGGLNSNLGHACARGANPRRGNNIPRKDWRQRRRYTRSENKQCMKIRRKWARKQRVIEKEEPQEIAEDDPKWHFWIPRQFEVQREETQWGTVIPLRGKYPISRMMALKNSLTHPPQKLYTRSTSSQNTLVRAAKESRVWDDLRTGPPASFAAYLVQVSEDTNSGAAPVQYAAKEGSEEGFEQPEIQVGGNTSVFTRLTQLIWSE
ncbi:hypothetical protein B0H14DRAFT_3530003 [Mycena olivaceomarginata]|nr:hypothetical protein B0H14DRAFT_3530003 [Mycena olivaceomarginata]